MPRALPQYTAASDVYYMTKVELTTITSEEVRFTDWSGTEWSYFTDDVTDKRCEHLIVDGSEEEWRWHCTACQMPIWK